MNDKKPEEQERYFDNALLERVRKLLTSSEPHKWQLAGKPLNKDTRVARPQNVYERVLVRDIPAGALVLHCVQPVQSQYLPGGYALSPVGTETYTIELRDRIFDADKLIDPRFAANFKGRKCDIVATGEVAKVVFEKVYESVATFHQDRGKLLAEKARELIEKLPNLVESTAAKDWVKTKEALGDEDILRFTGQFEEMKVELTRSTRDWEPTYSLKLQQEKFVHEGSGSLAKTLFKRLEEKEQNSQLESLGKILEDLGFKEE